MKKKEAAYYPKKYEKKVRRQKEAKSMGHYACI